MTYQVSINDDQTAADFEMECAKMGYRPEELFQKVIMDAVGSKRRTDVEETRPKPVEVQESEIEVVKVDDATN